MRVFLWCMLFVLCGTVPLTASESEENACFSLSRSLPEEGYVPGKAVSIVVTVAQHCDRLPSAIGFSETISDDWEFVQMEMLRGAAPAVFPFAGKTEKLEFAWITPPQFPVKLEYTLKARVDSPADLLITGLVLFRFDGPEFRSESVETTLSVRDSVPAVDGEIYEEGEDKPPHEEGETEPAPNEIEAAPGCCAAEPQKKGALPSSLGDCGLLGLAFLSLLFLKKRR